MTPRGAAFPQPLWLLPQDTTSLRLRHCQGCQGCQGCCGCRRPSEYGTHKVHLQRCSYNFHHLPEAAECYNCRETGSTRESLSCLALLRDCFTSMGNFYNCSPLKSSHETTQDMPRHQGLSWMGLCLRLRSHPFARTMASQKEMLNLEREISDGFQ